MLICLTARVLAPLQPESRPYPIPVGAHDVTDVAALTIEDARRARRALSDAGPIAC